MKVSFNYEIDDVFRRRLSDVIGEDFKINTNNDGKTTIKTAFRNDVVESKIFRNLAGFLITSRVNNPSVEFSRSFIDIHEISEEDEFKESMKNLKEEFNTLDIFRREDKKHWLKHKVDTLDFDFDAKVKEIYRFGCCLGLMPALFAEKEGGDD